MICADYAAEKILNPSWMDEDRERRAQGMFKGLAARPFTKSGIEDRFANNPNEARKYCDNWSKNYPKDYQKVVDFLNKKSKLDQSNDSKVDVKIEKKPFQIQEKTCIWSEKLKPRLLQEAACDTKNQGICTGLVACTENGKTYKALATCSVSFCNDNKDSALNCKNEKGFYSKLSNSDSKSFGTDPKDSTRTTQ